MRPHDFIFNARFVLLSALACALAAPQSGCGGKSGNPAETRKIPDSERPATVTGPVWRAANEPFSPTLPHLFDDGRIFVMPANRLEISSATLPAAQYGFSAVDRYGRVYHFDRQGRWWMTPGHSLPATLPARGWDAAYNDAAGQPELLLTAPWNGRTSMTLLRWRHGVWRPVETPESEQKTAASTPTMAIASTAIARSGATAVTEKAKLPARPTPKAAAGATSASTPEKSLYPALGQLRQAAARREARRLFDANSHAWLVAGGETITSHPVKLAAFNRLGSFRIAGALIQPGIDATPLEPAPALIGPAKPANGGGTPDFRQTQALLNVTTAGEANLLLKSGELWAHVPGGAHGHGAWRQRKRLPEMDHLLLAKNLPGTGNLLFVWQFGRGYDKILLLPAACRPDEKLANPDALNQTAQVKINQEDEGFWRGWGRIVDEQQKDGSTKPVFTNGFAGPGEDAVHITGEVGDAYFRRNELRSIELPPRIETLRPAATAWVPALGGLLVPSVEGVGLAAQHSAFFPDAAANAATGTRSLIDVIEHTYRFWVFKNDVIDWMKAPQDIHPVIGYPDTYFGGDNTRRTLSWTFPEPGLFRFEYHESSPQNQQWGRSPLLTLRALPQLAWNPNDELIICDPVVWGDPAQVVLIGWCGKLAQPRKAKELRQEIGADVYTVTPTRGFMARISALNPQEWSVSDLPIAFCQGGRLVSDSANGKIIFVGGRRATPHAIDGKPYFAMMPNTMIWEWDSKTWNCIKPDGALPHMKVTSNVTLDPKGGMLLTLTPRELYGFQDSTWQMLWGRPKPRGEDWPDELGLYTHPESKLILGVWFKALSEMHVWNGENWQPVLGPEGPQQISWPADAKKDPAGAWPTATQNLVPGNQPDCFIALDGEKLAQMRMDVPRNRDEDRLMGARMIQLTYDEKTQVTVPAPGLLGQHN